MKLLVLLLTIVALAASTTWPTFSTLLFQQEWKAFKAKHGKEYLLPGEDLFRLSVYVQNKMSIAKHNTAAERGEHTFFQRMNQFGDMLHHEFVSTMNGYKQDLKNDVSTPSLSIPRFTFIPPAHIRIPKNIDWRDGGAVTPVKNQGQCGSCWSFSATGSLEGQNFRKTGKLVSLSEQNLVDCSGYEGNQGCSGGAMDLAFDYIQKNHGIDTERSYPYEGKEGVCRYRRADRGAGDVGFMDIPRKNETALEIAVATVGPISVAIDAGHKSFQFYSHGVYSEPRCHTELLDHGVLVVGYGVDKETGLNYWLVKNSWDVKWGEMGYIKMAKDQHNACGIATAASYPLV